MNVPSLPFLAFAASIALLINVSAKPMWRRCVLLLANVAFVLSFTHSPRQLLPFGLLLLYGFAAVKLFERRKDPAAFWLVTAGALATFCCLKRYAFVPEALTLSYTYFTVGMSYVFFRIMHLVIDTYQGAMEEPVGALSYANFTLNFTSLVSGPIVCYRDYLRTESEAPAPLDAGVAWRALERIAYGFFKVSIVSAFLLTAQHAAIAAVTTDLGPGERVLDVVALISLFPLYLYANFSGYMDVVIGVGRFLRLGLPENFNNPFASTGFIELWNRWHITLSNWLKTYVYWPLLMNLMRRFPAPALEPFLGVFVYFVTFFLVGAWHGQTAAFLFLGVMYGVGTSGNRLYQIVMLNRLGRVRYRALCVNRWYVVLSRGLTFSWLGFSMLWFWSTWGDLIGFGRSLGLPAVAAGVALLVVGAGAVLTLLVRLERPISEFTVRGVRLVEVPYVRTVFATVVAMLSVSVTVLLRAPVTPIVYKGF